MRSRRNPVQRIRRQKRLSVPEGGMPTIISETVIGPHATHHHAGGSDPLDIKLLAGYPNDVTKVLLGNATFGTVSTIGRWEPLTNGDPSSPEILFSNGDVIMAFVS